MQTDGGKMETVTVTDFILLCSKITVDSDCSQEIKRHLLLGGKAMTNLDSILIFIGRTAAEDEVPIVWPPDAKS